MKVNALYIAVKLIVYICEDKNWGIEFTSDDDVTGCNIRCAKSNLIPALHKISTETSDHLQPANKTTYQWNKDTNAYLFSIFPPRRDLISENA
jgi:hypothetical protein